MLKVLLKKAMSTNTILNIIGEINSPLQILRFNGKI
jgi:hypothetical protein